jgi:drug/metabolite transporter (DMT)-like permease
MNSATFFLIVVSVSFNALAQVLLRKGMLTLGPVPSMSDPVALLALWLAVLSRTEVSVAYPMLSLGYLLAAALSFFYLGETTGIARLAGIVLICAGVFLVARTA